MSPALNGSSAIRRFERSDAIEIRNRITFDFYTGLPHMRLWGPGWIGHHIYRRQETNIIVCDVADSVPWFPVIFLIVYSLIQSVSSFRAYLSSESVSGLESRLLPLFRIFLFPCKSLFWSLVPSCLRYFSLCSLQQISRFAANFDLALKAILVLAIYTITLWYITRGM